jgi:hypothetical protein
MTSVDGLGARDSIEFVRANRAQFLGAAIPDLRDLASLLVVDALVLGAEDVSVLRRDEWYIVSSTFDWLLVDTKLNEFESFKRIQVFHKHRKNSNRSNILIAAFSANVITFSPAGEVLEIKGCDSKEILENVKLMEEIRGRRAILFRGLQP